jgi:hypothetical protein
MVPMVSAINPTAQATAGTRKALFAETLIPLAVDVTPNRPKAVGSVSEIDFVSAGFPLNRDFRLKAI